MPSTVAGGDEGPTVPSSFANNFWGKDDAGVHPMLERMHAAKVTSDELKNFYSTRAAIEDEYSRKLLALCRKPLGSCESGTLRASLDVVRGEVDSMAKSHQGIAAQMKTELEEPLAAFAGGLKERRKIVQGGVEKLLKVKIQQTQAVNKSRDRFEQDCLKIKGYLAQGHMVMGQEERKNRSKLEKTQIQMASNSNEYEAAVKVLEDTSARWKREWQVACDKFQDFEEERINFTKSSLWTFANISSTVCVSDDGACENMRLSLENCEVEKDIRSFIAEQGTGQESPPPPKYINFNRGDIDDSASEASQEEYSVAQYPRQINPVYRTSSPVPSTLESHHNPDNKLDNRERTITPQRAGQPDFRRQAADIHAQVEDEEVAIPHNEYPADGMTMFCRSDNYSDLSSASSAMRPASRDTDLSNATSVSSVEAPSGKSSPTKRLTQPPPMESPIKEVQKRRSGFFSNSPFRRKSKHEKERPTSRFGIARGGDSASSRNGISTHDFAQDENGEPVDPRASFQLNVGQNVFDVASPDAPRGKSRRGTANDDIDDDPIAAALAELKDVAKQSTARVTADRYAGMATPAPPQGPQGGHQQPAGRSTPPPGYSDGGASAPVRRLDAPQPAHTAAQMRAATNKYAAQNADMYGTPNRRGQPQQSMPRSTSPMPMRSASPRPGMHPDTRRSASPNPQSGRYSAEMSRPSPQQQQQRRPRPQSQSPQKAAYGSWQGGSPGGGGGANMRPQPQYARQERPSSAGNMSGGAMTLHQGDGGALGQSTRRPMSYYGGSRGGSPGGMDMVNNGGRKPSRTGGSGQFTRDGREIIHFAKAMYTYSAAIPEELSFSKGEVLAVLRLQDDGWWEAEVTTNKGVPGLVPSNYLQRI